MATQTGSIDLEATNAVKLAAEASVDNKLTNYTTHTQLNLSADQIRGEVAETYATKSEAALELSKSGTVVALDEAADARLKALTIHGKSVQDGTPSPSSPVEIESVEATNLLDYEAWKSVGITNGTAVFENNGVTLTASANDCFTATAVPTAARVPVTEGEVVYLTWDSPDTYSGYCYIFPNGTTSGMKSSDNSGARFVQYVVAAGITYISFRMGVATAGNTIHYENIRITKTRATGYAPKGSISVRSSRNLFNGISVAQSVTNGVTWSYDADSNRLKASGTPTANNNDLRINFKTPITVPEGITSITFSFDGTFVSNNTYFFMYDSANGWSYRSITSEGKCTFTDMGGHAFSYCMVRTYTNSGNISIDATIQVEYGTEATEHALYSPAVAYIDLQGNALRSLPDGTHDEWVSGETEDTLVQRVGHVVLDGTWSGVFIVGSTASSSLKMFLLQIAKFTEIFGASAAPRRTGDAETDRGCVYCDLLPRRTTAYNVWTDIGISGWSDASAAFLFAPGEGLTTSDEFKTWLNSHPLEILYPLATPVTTTLPHVDLPIVHDGDSVWVDAQVTPTIDVAYWSKNGETVSALSSTLTQTAAGLELELQGKVDSSEEWVSWMHAGTDPTTHEPYLAMGQDSDYPSVVYGGSAAKFYDGEGDADSNVVASFGAEGAVVGNVDSSHTSITPEVTAFHDANGNEAARISMSDQGAVTAFASYSVNPASSWTDRTETGITPLPDFTLGDLELTVSVDGEVIHSYSISSLTESQISVTYGDIDIKFQATKSGDTWTAAMSCRNRDLSAQPTVTFGLSWEHIGTAPMWKFGGATAQGAYSFSAGDGNQPTGEGAVTLGLGLVANRQAQVVVGKHNKPYQSARFIVGNGTDDAGRSNALAVTDQGIETVGYIQTGGTVGLGSEAQQAWQTALGLFNLFHFKTVTSSSASVASGSVVEFTATIPDVSGMTCRGAVQVWTSGTGTTIVGAPWRSAGDSKIHSKVRGNVASNVSVSWLLFYTADAFTTTS